VWVFDIFDKGINLTSTRIRCFIKGVHKVKTCLGRRRENVSTILYLTIIANNIVIFSCTKKIMKL